MNANMKSASLYSKNDDNCTGFMMTMKVFLMRRSSKRAIRCCLFLGLFIFIVLGMTVGKDGTSWSSSLSTRNDAHSGLHLPRRQSPVKTQLLLVTFGRSGSTFTSAIISYHPSVFFTSEPLHNMPKDIYSGLPSKSTRQQAVDTIIAFLTCDFSTVDPRIFASVMFAASGSTIELFNCLRRLRGSAYAYLGCFLDTMKSCKKHTTTLVKTIRLNLEWIDMKAYMKQNLHLKILFLVRDFRAVLYSQARVFQNFNLTKEAFTHKAQGTCGLARTQLIELQELRKLYPNRIKGVRYEDGCLDPIKYARDIYKFANLQFDARARDYVNNITRGGRSTRANKDYTVVKKDSIKTMNRWRKTASLDLVQEVDKWCSEIFDDFGYKTVNSKTELMSENHSLVTSPKSRGLFS